MSKTGGKFTSFAAIVLHVILLCESICSIDAFAFGSRIDRRGCFYLSPSGQGSDTDLLEEQCLIDKHLNGLTHIKLNRPRQLNALNSNILLRIYNFLLSIQDETTPLREPIKVLLLTGDKRSFCSGGDLKHCLSLLGEDSMLDGERDRCLAAERRDKVPQRDCVENPAEFLRLEYRVQEMLYELNERVKLITYCNGIVMGAGQGLYAAAGVRMMGEDSVFAMPECAIGLAPDGGSFHFLASTLPEVSYSLMYVLLTGAKLSASDCVRASRIAIPAENSIEELINLLTTSDLDSLDTILPSPELANSNSFHAGDPGDSVLTQYSDSLERIFVGSSSVREVHERARKEELLWETSDLSRANWCRGIIGSLQRHSPAAQVITFHAVKAAQSIITSGNQPRKGPWSRAVSLDLEYSINSRLIYFPDFKEGVECLLGSKKGAKPKWVHESWEEATDDPFVKSILKIVEEL